MNFPAIYLASSSPRRRELLNQIGVRFSVLTVDVDETILSGESPKEYVKRLAIKKAQTGWDSIVKDQKKPVLGYDTSVVLEDRVIGKPQNKDEARQMLQALSGRMHQVITAVALVSRTETQCRVNISSVCFRKITEDEVDWYLSTDEGMDKAGGYAVQGLAAIFISELHGSYSAVMGLPLMETGLLLEEMREQ